MIKLLSSEWLRTKRTAIRWLTFCMPVIFSLCAAAYLASKTDSTQEFAFEGFFTIWTVFIIPLGTGILAGFIVQEEALAGNFNGLLGTGLSRIRLYLGKFLLLLFCMAVCTFIAVLTLCAGMNTVMPSKASLPLFLGAAALTVVGTLPLLALHLWVSFAWGMGASVGISIGGLLMAALMGLTGLGSKIWPFIPWTWPVKLGMLPGVCFLADGDVISKPEIASGILNTASAGLGAAAIGIILFLLGGILWFNIWEGRKNCE